MTGTLLRNVTAACCVALAVLTCPPAAANTYADVSWAASIIDAITSAGVMEGCGGSFFCPDRPVTREDMAVWLERASRGSSFTPPPPTGVFDDVPVNYCLAGWIEQLKADGFTAGCSEEPPLYCPYNPVNRAQMAVFLLRLEHGLGYKPPDLCPAGGTGSFADVPCWYWAADWIEQLYQEGITSGCADNPLRYCPYEEVNRAQMAVFLTATCRRDGAQCAASW